MKIDGINYLGVELQFDYSTVEEVKNSLTSFDFGTLRLTKGEDEMILRGFNPQANGFRVFVELKEDKDREKKNKLKNLLDLDVAEFQLGDEYEIEPCAVTLFVTHKRMAMAIDLTTF